MPREPVLYLDADTRHADWIKTGRWDMTTTAEQIWDMPLEQLKRLMALPAWEAAPAELKTAARDRLAIT